MNSNDLISVIIPAYNHERYVQDTINSILKQTYPNIELIIVNDGSPDRTHNKIKELLPQCQAHFRRVEYINKENEGVIKSLNLCLSLAQGEYVYAIASDDRASTHALEILHTYLSQHRDVGLAVGDNQFIDETNRRCFWSKNQSRVYDANKAYSLTHAEHLKKLRPDVDFSGSLFGSYPTLLSGNYIPNGYLIRKSLLDLTGGYSDQAPLEDLHLMLQIAKQAKMKYIDQILFDYRWHDTNTIKQKTQMGTYQAETLKLEHAYAKEHGLLEYLPCRHSFSLCGMPIINYSRTYYKTVLRIFGISVIRAKTIAGKKTTKLFGIPIHRATRSSPGKE